MDATLSPTPPATTLARSDRTVLAAAGAVVIGALFGIVIGAWDVQPFALVMITLGLTVGGVMYASATMDVSASLRRHLPAVGRIAAVIATALAALALFEFVGDLDDLEEVGGFLGLATAVIVLVGAATMLATTVRGAAPDVRSSARGTQLALVGAVLVLGAWTVHLTVGFWSFSPAVWGIAAIVLAAGLLVFGPTKTRISAVLGWVAAGLGAFAALIAVGQWSKLMELGATRLELGPGDVLPFLVYVAGILLVIAGGVIHATGGRIALPTVMPAGERASS